MTDDPNDHQNLEAAKLNAATHARAIVNAVDTVWVAITHFTDKDRKHVLDQALDRAKSRLAVLNPHQD